MNKYRVFFHMPRNWTDKDDVAVDVLANDKEAAERLANRVAGLDGYHVELLEKDIA